MAAAAGSSDLVDDEGVVGGVVVVGDDGGDGGGREEERGEGKGEGLICAFRRRVLGGTRCDAILTGDDTIGDGEMRTEIEYQ